jgi:hypothetical protein
MDNLYSPQSMELFEKACIEKKYDTNEHIVMIFENNKFEKAHCLSKADLILKLTDTQYFLSDHDMIKPLLVLGNIFIKIQPQELVNMLSLKSVSDSKMKKYYHAVYVLSEPFIYDIIKIDDGQAIYSSEKVVYKLRYYYENQMMIKRKMATLNTIQYNGFQYVGETKKNKPFGYGMYSFEWGGNTYR